MQHADKKYLVFASIVFLAILYLFPQLYFSYFVYQAHSSIGQGDFASARKSLDHAQPLMGYPGLGKDLARYHLVNGQFSLHSGKTAGDLKKLFENTEQAEQHFQKVITLDPLSIKGYIGLAQATAILERVYPLFKKQNYPFSAGPVFKKLIALMPTQLYAHTLFIDYLASRGLSAELIKEIPLAIQVSPSLYYKLVKTPYYNTELHSATKNTLTELSASRDNNAAKADKVLSDIALKEENYQKAIEYYKKTEPARSPYYDYSPWDRKLGDLYLKAGLFKEAEQTFQSTLKNSNKKDKLQSIWETYKSNQACDHFVGFHFNSEDLTLQTAFNLMRAKCLLTLERLELANALLLRIETGPYAAESFYLQARIAENNKDWDKMELLSQRATVLAPNKSSYHLLFSKSLKQQLKWQQAEKAATMALQTASGNKAGLYDYRAGLKWKEHDYEGAKKDWNQAIELNPNNPWYFVNLARVYEQEGSYDQALKMLTKARALAPANKSINKQFSNLHNKIKTR